MSDSTFDLRPFTFAVALAACATVLLEISLTRVFSVTLFYHFASMIIAQALLGLATAGVAVYLLPKVFRPERAAWQAGLSILLFGLTAPLPVMAATAHPIDLYHSAEHTKDIAIVYAAAAVPFIFSGFAITLAISNARSAIGRVYAFDLVGAGLGCLAVIPALYQLGAPGAVFLTGALGTASGVLFILSHRAKARPRLRVGGVAIAALATVVLIVFAVGESDARRLGQVKNPHGMQGQRELIFEGWSPIGQVTVGPSHTPTYRWIYNDAGAATRLWPAEAAANNYEVTRSIEEIRLASLVYSIRHDGPIVVIGAGGGTDIISALHYGAQDVTGVEINRVIVEDVMGDVFGEYSGHLYQDERVRVLLDEGRSVVRRSEVPLAVVQATLVDTWAASSAGAFTLSENSLYTVDAMTEFIGSLRDDGVVVMTRWRTAHEFLRLVVTAHAALVANGVSQDDVRRHIFIAASRPQVAVLVSRSPFSEEDIATLERQSAADRLRVMYSPTMDPAEAAEREGVSNVDARVLRFLATDDTEGFLDDLDFEAHPATDDRPYFFYTLFPGQLLDLFKSPGGGGIHNVGVILLGLVLLFSVVLTASFVLLPLFVLRRNAIRERRREKLRVLLFFLCLGFGFIIVEIWLIHRLVIFLGHPTYSLTVVLATLLIGSGIGSVVSGRLTERFGVRGLVLRVGVALLATLLVLSFGLQPVLQAAMGMSLTLRIVAAGVLTAALGVMMGMLLPCGVRAANQLGPEVVPWGWGLNGATSVVGSIVTVFLSMNLGFSYALIFGFAAYVVGILVFPKVDGPRAAKAP